MGWRGLYRAGIRIGRDHIASVVDTLVLAYARAALPLLLLFSIAQSGVGTVADSALVAEETGRCAELSRRRSTGPELFRPNAPIQPSSSRALV
ncbi:hypothetical protein AQI95_24160 [Streptomyces yokosukanensis]|uniref:Uncharacterized protein n=1 Tax=Streptomyces yokosukanensis TaxID=67386 RepID=A0A101P279_9ACTN|nr:hypothetical protein AQI95_24160 [Streptomyces yokosukanensis]